MSEKVRLELSKREGEVIWEALQSHLWKRADYAIKIHYDFEMLQQEIIEINKLVGKVEIARLTWNTKEEA